MKHTFETEYRTKDLGEAAALMSSSIRLLRLEKAGNIFWFIFDEKIKSERLSDEYWSGDLEVKAKSYDNALRTLKDRLFARN